ncbi:MAG: type I-U CRISPR-associated protein Cas7 [Deltaproteobacteria bacterium]|nr:MAG: type I-U CRISPR-associated protein Cas7 [Deltaproteobacteria bacterium]
MSELNLSILSRAVAGETAAFRVVSRLQPAGGPGDKLFPATFSPASGAETKYAREVRRIDGEDRTCVLIDSVASQANRMELALLRAWERGQLELPMLAVDFARFDDLVDLGRISVFEAPHRIADAIFRDSELQGTAFRMSDIGRAVTDATPRAATPLLHWCPSALVFGLWDSTGPKGGLGAKYQRAISSEIVGIGAAFGVKTASRIDPLGIERKATIFEDAREAGAWTPDEQHAAKKKGAPIPHGDGRPSTVNHGNVAPSIDTEAGGVTVDYALQTTVLSLPALRRLAFPTRTDGTPIPRAERLEAERAAHTALAALGLAAIVFARTEGYDLRSRCALVPEDALRIEALPADGGEGERLSLSPESAAALVRDALAAAEAVGLGWSRDEILLTPAERLLALVRKSRSLAMESTPEEGE